MLHMRSQIDCVLAFCVCASGTLAESFQTVSSFIPGKSYPKVSSAGVSSDSDSPGSEDFVASIAKTATCWVLLGEIWPWIVLRWRSINSADYFFVLSHDKDIIKYHYMANNTQHDGTVFVLNWPGDFREDKRLAETFLITSLPRSPEICQRESLSVECV